MRVFPDRMRENLDATGGLIFSQGVLLALVDRGLDRDDAYAIVQDAAARAWDAGEAFRDVLWADIEPRELLSREEFDVLFDPKPFLRHLDGVFARLEKLPLTPET
jgi:adenylosuccinate lyase